MLKDVQDLSNDDVSSGLNTVKNIFAVKPKQTPNCQDVNFEFDGSVSKRLGSKLQNATSLGGSALGGFSVDSDGTLDDGLTLYYKLDEVSGERVDIKNSKNLTEVNYPKGISGRVGNAALFIASSSQGLYRNSDAILQTGNIDFSLAAWVYINTTGDYTIISKVSRVSNDTTTLLLLHADGADGNNSFIDSSPRNCPITAFGGCNTDTDQKKFGSASLYCVTAGDGVYVNSGGLFNIGTADFTIDFQMRRPSTSPGGYTFYMGSGEVSLLWVNGDGKWELEISPNVSSKFSSTVTADSWVHVALTRAGSTARLFQDGTQLGTNMLVTGSINCSSFLFIGENTNNASSAGLRGWIDEFRILKGVCAWTGNFTAPTAAYDVPYTYNDYEYSLDIDSDNQAVFRVSSSGTGTDGLVKCTSFGALSTATWYNIVAWHSSANHTIGISVNLSETSAAYATTGVRAGTAPLAVGMQTSSPYRCFDGKIDEVSFYKVKPTTQHMADLYNGGNGQTYSEGFREWTWGGFDFGASQKRWFVVAAGTGLYASSDLGVNFTVIGTDRAATWSNFERSKGVLIATTNSYNNPVYWAGSGGTYVTLMNASAPLAKYAVSHQGYLILLNTNQRKRGFYYEDENTQLTGDWGDFFDIPSSADDEITCGIVLRKNLYVSTRYKLFRVSYVGGNPDWSYSEVKNWGFVPHTVRKITLKDVGEVVIGMDWSRNMRLFDGADDRIISDVIKYDNSLCEFAMDKISGMGSGLLVSHAEIDPNSQVYYLNVAIGQDSSNTTDIISMNARNMAFQPWGNQQWQFMAVAESNNLRYLLAGDRSGGVYLLNSGNLDKGTTAIDDYFDSTLLYVKSPSEVNKTKKMDLYFSSTTSGTIYFKDRVDFSKTFKDRDTIKLIGQEKVMVKKSIDIPVTQGTYQFRITSSGNTNDPWQLNRQDLFLQNMGIGDNP